MSGSISAEADQGPEPDLAFVNGSVITMDPAGRIARAAAVRGDRIVEVGSTVRTGPRTRLVDLAGGALLPGINDSHLHAGMLGAYWPATWLAGLAAGGGLPEPRELRTEDDRRAALRRAWDVLLPLGITGYTEPGLGPGADGQHGGSCGSAMLATYRALAAAGELPVRVTALLLYGEMDGPGELDDLVAGLAAEEPPGSGDAWWRVAGVKIFADGIPPMRTAWMSKPYADGPREGEPREGGPGEGGGRGGLLTAGPGEMTRVRALRAMIERADAAGWQIGVHATGDAAIDAVVRALAGASDGRHYVIHGDCASPDALAAMARHGIGLNAQPAIYDVTRDLLAAALGPDRAARAFPLRAALGAGVRLCLSSDAPVLAPDWRRSVAAAATRAEAPIPVYEALRAYTIHPARQDGAERWKGSIEPGKVADLCVLARDPLAVPAEEIPDIDVTMTVVGGAIRHDR